MEVYDYLHPPTALSQVPFYQRIDEPKGLSGGCGKKKNTFLPLHGIEPR
jgi:hypothetical protein